MFLKTLPAFALCAFTLAGAAPQALMAETESHLVSPSALQQAAVDASTQRQQHIDTLRSAFASEQGQKALEAKHMDATQVNKAIGSLSDDELATLSARTQKAQADFAAGTLSDRDLILILVAIAVLILLIVIFH